MSRDFRPLYFSHRYLMGRLPLHGFYLWRHVLSTAPPFILRWWHLEILFDPLSCSSSFLGGQRWQSIQMGHSRAYKGKEWGWSRYSSHFYDFSSNNSIWATDPRVKVFLNINSNSPRLSTLKCPFFWQSCQWHRLPLVGAVNDTADHWWAVSMISLINSEQCQWHR
jgi:hypothetical protein